MTGINIIGAMTALMILHNTLKRYLLPIKMKWYAFIRGAGMVALILMQFYNLTNPGLNWIVNTGVVYWWGAVIYWAWAIRYSSLKK